MNTKIPLFAEEYAFLSNFHVSPFKWGGYIWPTVEHAYQAEKTINSFEQQLIREAKHPGEAKKIGRKVVLRENWDALKVPAMTEFVWQKFKQNDDLREQLLNTENAKLVEGNHWHDNFWGDCYCNNCLKIEGKNILGLILMKVREEMAKPLVTEYVPTYLRKEIVDDVEKNIY
jgi:hypothetical protein